MSDDIRHSQVNGAIRHSHVNDAICRLPAAIDVIQALTAETSYILTNNVND